MEDMDATEIEAVTGITKGAIKVHLFRAIRAGPAEIGRVE